MAKPPKLSAHFIGIGGIGMSALARWFIAQNWSVTGSDIANSQIIQELKKEGVKVKIGHKSGNLSPKTTMVVYNSAILDSNPELTTARRYGLRPLSYAQTIGCLTDAYRTIAIAGSHGKSTTTALTGLTLVRAKFDPNVIVGTKLKEFDGKNFRLGQSKWLVLEADEWKGAFWHYSPEIIIVTNIDREHLDFYKNLKNVEKSFLRFLARTRSGGTLILNRDDKNLYSLEGSIKKLSQKLRLKVYWYSLKDKEAKNVRAILQISGEHNVSNAMAVTTLAIKILKIPLNTVLGALKSYQGAWRRMEFKGKFKLNKIEIDVYDDYAHHPTEIKATLAAFKLKFPKRPLICIFEPHQSKRLQALFKDFSEAFRAADVTILLPAYEVAGRDTKYFSYTSEKLVKIIQKKYPHKSTFYLKDPKQIAKFLKSKLSQSKDAKPPVLVMMGAGTIVNYTPFLLK